MKNLFLVTIDVRLNRDDVVKHLSSLKGYGTWFYSMPSSFFIYSSLDAKLIGDDVAMYSGGDYRYFVTRVTGANYWGWMPKSHWKIVNDNGAQDRYDLTFKGYYRDVACLPNVSGVYCVYSGVLDNEGRSVTLNELLYIGKAENIYKRHLNHENKKEWFAKLSSGETLWYTFAEVDLQRLERCEAALIYLNHPKCNHSGIDSFNHYDTYISVSGAVALLKNNQVVEQTK
jgi:hypothetical protein